MKKTWFRSVNLRPQGPYSLEEMRAFIHRGEVGFQDLILDESKGDVWKAAADWGVFELTLFPAGQSFIPGMSINEEAQEWVVLVGQNGGVPLQEGPYSVADIKAGLKAGRISPYQLIWKSGLSGWCQVKDRPEYYSCISSDQLSSESL
ncbi:GYF domain-containing protein [Bdellovibrio sp. HCB288]|uniref:GYF domain-containing protein n=1 Tax=Bdellovibrio sp. HCB288 TaxID=3394355 RepID=UPI0039B38E75